MFTAYVIVCSLAFNYCMRFDDGQGPYEMREDCAARTYEMQTNVKTFWAHTGPPGPTRIEQYCEKDGERI